MKGDRTLVDIPFRYGGIMHNYDMDVEDWQGVINKRCWCCGGDMTRNMYLKSGVLICPQEILNHWYTEKEMHGQ